MSTYIGNNGNLLTLSNSPFWEQGDSTLYEIDSGASIDNIGKIYRYSDHILEQKINYMVECQYLFSSSPYIAWPKEMLKDQKNNFVGYVAKKSIHTNRLPDLFSRPLGDSDEPTLKDRLSIIKSLCNAVSDLHKSGIILGNLDPADISYSTIDYSVFLWNPDTFQMYDSKSNTTYKCSMTPVGYTAPEIIAMRKAYQHSSSPSRGNHGNISLPTVSIESDVFALAIIIFRLLMNGQSPYDGIDTFLPDILPHLSGDEAIEANCYCFAPGFRPRSDVVPSISSLPAVLQDCFDRAFVQGYSVPVMRPSPEDWLLAITQLEDELLQCSVNPNHFYFKSNSICPFCGNTQQGNFEYTFDDSNTAKENANNSHEYVQDFVNDSRSNLSHFSAPTPARGTKTSPVHAQNMWQEQNTYWVVTLLISSAIALVFLWTWGDSIYHNNGATDDVATGIINLTNKISPFLLFVGSLSGTILYNIKLTANNSCYTAKNYTLAILMGIIGIIVAGLLIYLLATTIYIAIIVFLVVMVVKIFSKWIRGDRQ